jgi:hypothetical protein
MSHLLPSASVLDHFSALSDPRQRWRVLYPLPEILLLVLCATLSGMEDFVEIRLWGEQPFQRQTQPQGLAKTRQPQSRLPPNPDPANPDVNLKRFPGGFLADRLTGRKKNVSFAIHLSAGKRFWGAA